jgi:OOP family OmpA-OmpF porin
MSKMDSRMKFYSKLTSATMLVTAAVFLPHLAKAQPVSGLYIGAGAGYDLQGNQKLPHAPGRYSGSTLEYNGGGAANVSVGYGLGNGLRFEIEGLYLGSSLSELKPGFVGRPRLTGGGDIERYGAMANVLYDFNIGLPFYPYLGAGAGYLWEAPQYSDNGRFAYQGIAGVAFPLHSVPGLSLTLDYRYIGTPGTKTFSDGDVTYGPVSNQTFMAGLRYAFNTPSAAPPPPPAPVMAPAPAAARTYLVFFDWDQYALTPRAKEIVAEAAANSTHVQYTQIEVNGYTDTSGTPSYNQGLSVRRANSVQAQLIADGVPASAIAIAGYGDTHLLVPTGPGVREPQNRRVEIIIR